MQEAPGSAVRALLSEWFSRSDALRISLVVQEQRDGLLGDASQGGAT